MSHKALALRALGDVFEETREIGQPRSETLQVIVADDDGMLLRVRLGRVQR